MTVRPALPGLRLIDGVILAAVALLGLKTLGVLSVLGQDPEPARPGFARVISNARSNDVPDPVTTGSVEPKPPEKPAEKAPEPAPAAAEAPAAAASRSERALLERLGERREELQQRAREMEAREKLIEDNERRLEQRRNEVKAIEERQQALAARKEEGGAASLKNLVTMYETMKAKEAARVFDKLPHDVLVPVVLGMNPRKMAEVLAAMAPDAAQKLTVALAKRAKGDERPAPSISAGLPSGELPAIDPPRR